MANKKSTGTNNSSLNTQVSVTEQTASATTEQLSTEENLATESEQEKSIEMPDLAQTNGDDTTNSIINADAAEKAIVEDGTQDGNYNDNQSTNIEPPIVIVTKPENIESDEELLKAVNPSKDWTPYGNKRITRSYVDSGGSKEPPIERVPETKYKDIPATGSGSNSGGVSTGAGTSKAQSKTVSSSSPAPESGTTPVTPLTPDEQKNQAEMLADALIGAYRQANALGAWAVKVDDSKITEWELDELISDEMELPVGPNGTKVNVRTFFAEFGKAVDLACNIPDAYFDDVRQSMIRMFVKREIGLSDEANVAQFFTRDVLMRMGNFYSLYRQRVINTKQIQAIWAQQKMIIELAKRGNNIAPEATPQATVTDSSTQA